MGGRGRAVVLGALLLAAIQLSGCADATRYVGVGLNEEAFIIEGVPSIRQGPELSCGPACVASVATYWTHAIPPNLREAVAPFRKKRHLRHGSVRGGEKPPASTPSPSAARSRTSRSTCEKAGPPSSWPTAAPSAILRFRCRTTRRSSGFSAISGRRSTGRSSSGRSATNGSSSRIPRRQVPGAEDAPHERLEAERLRHGAPGAASAAGLGFRS